MAKKTSTAKTSERHEHHLPDDDIATRGGALPHGEDEVPDETPDTQESLYSEDHAYRVDEEEGQGKRHATPIESPDGSGRTWLSEEELDRIDDEE